ncbi:MAG: 6-hydroxycyclohex-1-ene-1-carbonyl-CoA dehydrogenase [Candidatus Koribacter versatilis]|uniref:6-hydroxycyclohex-1-ene-1-carbonyl-CoA dehydrogenase n=1 Tax=Candidatus Korobacter versatilis TaxID=658062 RepID=A0A932A9D3_9BACT|nr:6-hydroxycyclohex-1-ene-1-carbonyl-CoA dehydrogenase [Candidatus Koribacter versatilis]
MQPAYGYELIATGAPLARCELMLAPAPDEVIVEVAGCGVCHTDVGFAYDGVPTRHPLPLILGHEISGRVVEAGELAAAWLRKNVIVPAVVPCGRCPACQAGRPTVCSKQFMPGNDGHGGFATHVRVPARGLCQVPDKLPAGVTLEMLSVVADAVSTPYEAIRRSGLGAEDVAVFVGAGGVGGFGVQIAAAMGAAVVAVDVDQCRLELAAQHGASLALNTREMDEKELKKRVRTFAKESGKRGIGMKVFETSGTPGGQQTAFHLLDFGGYLAVVGFTPKKTELRLSNLMALDATARGNWGCPPEQYPAALQLVLDGKVALAPYVESRPLDDAPEVLEAVAHRALKRRVILKPSRNGDRS